MAETITFRTAKMETGQLIIDIPHDQRGSVMHWLKNRKDRDYDLTIGRFYTTYKDRIKRNDLLKVMKGYMPRQILAEGRGVGGSKEVTFARIFLRMYNKNRTKNRLEDII